LALLSVECLALLSVACLALLSVACLALLSVACLALGSVLEGLLEAIAAIAARRASTIQQIKRTHEHT
jgi:hypothetical protein